jgi:GDPmannose 4,6-dehydratase
VAFVFIMPRALIIGVTGQDGYYLSKLLADHGYELYGTSRFPDKADPELRLLLKDLLAVDLTDVHQAAQLVQACLPEEVYYLAAHHFSSQDSVNESSHWPTFLAVNVLSVRNVLQTLSESVPESRFFYAASAHIFGIPTVCPQTELTPTRPNTLYGITKNAGMNLCRYYRDTHALHASTGILYNHESPRRGLNFVTSRIARAAALCYLGKSQTLDLLNLEAVVDWGAAQDYVRAMWLILQHAHGDDFIVSTGTGRTVREFAEMAFGCLGLRAEKFIGQQQEGNFGDLRLPYIGDSTKISETCRWKRLIPFEDMVKNMVMEHLVSLR